MLTSIAIGLVGAAIALMFAWAMLQVSAADARAQAERFRRQASPPVEPRSADDIAAIEIVRVRAVYRDDD